MTRTIRFTEQEVDAFAVASGDVNPLHLSSQFARRTFVGERVVHGALVAIRAMKVHLSAQACVTSLRASFESPVLPEVDYQSSATVSDTGIEIVLRDGQLVKMRQRLTAMTSKDWMPWSSSTLIVPRTEPTPGGLFAAADVDRVGPYLAALDELMLPEGIQRVGLALCAASYLAGMECPGLDGMIRRIGVEVVAPHTQLSPLWLSLALRSRAGLERGVARYEVAAFTDASDEPAIRMEIASFLRPPASVLDHPQIPHGASASGAAVITGSSRGLGAALVDAVQSMGLRPIGLQRTPSSDPRRRQCDVGDAAQVSTVTDLLRPGGLGLRLLVLNAASPLQEHSVDHQHLGRISTYLSREAALTLNPLTTLLPQLSQESGTCVLISTALLDPEPQWVTPKHWSHYLAAKASSEKLIRGASESFPSVGFVIARLPPIDTDFTFLTRVDRAADPGWLARELLVAVEEVASRGRAVTIPGSRFLEFG